MLHITPQHEISDGELRRTAKSANRLPRHEGPHEVPGTIGFSATASIPYWEEAVSRMMRLQFDATHFYADLRFDTNLLSCTAILLF